MDIFQYPTRGSFHVPKPLLIRSLTSGRFNSNIQSNGLLFLKPSQLFLVSYFCDFIGKSSSRVWFMLIDIADFINLE